MHVKAKAMSRKQIRELAQFIRQEFGLENELHFPIVEFIEWVLGDPSNDFSYEIIPQDEMGSTYATVNTINNTMRISQDVYEGAVAGNSRDRFTLCHELGHFILHQPQFVSFARGEIPQYCNPEWQANTFAGELMAPYELIKNLSPEEISEKCGMSLSAARIQYKQRN